MICIFTFGENYCVAAVEPVGKQPAPGRLQLVQFKSLDLPVKNKKHIQTDVLFWWARRDLNPHVRSEH